VRIQLLSEQTINKIATGEIIDRPLSAVKELVENAIDAGATECCINLERGGRTLISVSDNGHGISQDNLELAITRYATSKLPDENISNIQYMGFRGEALAAIATAGKLKITTKRQGSTDAWMIDLGNGVNKIEIKPISHRQGTTVEVTDLFCFMPNRVRFLKPESSEVVACKNLIGALALGNPEIKFQFIHNQNEILNSRDNILDELLGEDFLRNAIPFDIDNDYRDSMQIKLNGYVSIPTYNRSVRNKIFTFVNKRFVRDNFINQLIRQAYFNTLPPGLNPSIILFIELPPHCIDVNIHPNKSEVRFSDERLISNAVINSIRNTIKNARTANINRVMNKPMHIRNNITHTNLPLELRDIQSEVGAQPIDTASYGNNNVQLGQAILQIADKYVIAQKNNSLIFVDQHAAHERIVLEQMKRIEFKVANFLLQIEYDFGPAENALIMSMSSNLQSIGIKVTLNNNKILVHSAPAIPGNLDIITLLKDIIENCVVWEEVFKNHLDEILKKVACYSSVRAGRKLTQSEMQNLLFLIETTPFSSQCIHGRPTYLELDIKTIDKLFERT
jgi:DNA mismatch repair protein MutL